MTGQAVARGTVSIVIPCFNAGDTLGETLASLDQLAKAFAFECIVVDDGSTDPETVRLLDAMDPLRYRMIRTPNRGLAAARNGGIAAATGEFIIPLDADNLLRAPYLAAGVECLSRDSTLGVVYGNAQYFGERQGLWQVADFDMTNLATANFIDACALFRKRLWSDLGGYDESMPHMGWEDWDFWMRAAQRGWTFHHLEEVAFDYRVRRGSMIDSTVRHAEALSGYIFGKPANLAAHCLREQVFELRRMKRSTAYRWGSAILAPARRLRGLFG